MKDLLFGVLTKTLNKSAVELSDLLLEKTDGGEELLKEGSMDLVLGLFEEKFNKTKTDFKEKLTEEYQKGYKKAKGETLEDFEKQIKEKFEVDGDIKGIELVDAVVEKFKAPPDSKLSPEKIKLTDTYRNREKELTKEYSDKLKEKEKEVEGLKAGFEKSKIWDTVSRDIRKVLMEMKPVLPKNQKAAENLISIFLDSYQEYDWQVGDNGEHLAIKEGNRVEDKLGNEVKFKALIESRVPDFFDLQVQDKRGNAGNDGGGGSPPADVPSEFADEQEYVKFIDSTNDPGKREQAYLNWKAQNK